MGWFEFGREEKYPTHYSDQNTPAHTDVLTAGLIFAFLILAISLFALLPGLNGKKRWIYFGRILCSLVIGGIVVLGNFGHEWEVAHAKIITPYKGGAEIEIKGNLGLHISLRGINITLTGAPKNIPAQKGWEDEVIDYNEHFSWEWDQGRFGFGYYSGRIAREYRAAVYRGIPTAILQVAEYFTFDEEGARFGRHYRHAGYYSHIMMWCAFSSWIISNILFLVLVRYAAMFLAATGLFQILAICIWTFVRNFIELQVPFESASHQKDEIILKTSFGPDYYVVLLNGILCIILGVIILFVDAFIPDEVCNFFGIDPLTTYEEYHLSHAELQKEGRRQPHLGNLNAMEQGYASPSGSSSPNRSQQRGQQEPEMNLLWRRRTGGSRLFKKSFKLRARPKKPMPTPRPPNQPGLPEAAEMSVRSPLLQPPKFTAPKSSSDEDEFSDYANLKAPDPNPFSSVKRLFPKK